MSEADEKRLAKLRAHDAACLRDLPPPEGHERNTTFLLRLLDAAREEIARLERERDAWEQSCRATAKFSEEHCARATRAESALAEARESLARAAGNMDGVALALELSETIDATAFAVNLRAFAKRARAALTPPSPDGSET